LRGLDLLLEKERNVVWQLYELCPENHSAEGEKECPDCGISANDYRRFIIGDEGQFPVS
jgi:hypothetical protein